MTMLLLDKCVTNSELCYATENCALDWLGGTFSYLALPTEVGLQALPQLKAAHFFQGGRCAAAKLLVKMRCDAASAQTSNYMLHGS